MVEDPTPELLSEASARIWKEDYNVDVVKKEMTFVYSYEHDEDLGKNYDDFFSAIDKVATKFGFTHVR